MKRREFLTVVSAVAAWPYVAMGQQPDRLRRIGVLMNLAASDAEGQARIGALLQGLERLGWTAGRTAWIDTRWAAGRADNYRTYARDLLALEPDVLVGVTTTAVRALQQASRSVPIVFVGVGCPPFLSCLSAAHSISRLPRRSASLCRPRCSPAPTR